MITRYKDFLSENSKNNWTDQDPEYYGITDYEWVDGKLNVNGDVNIRRYELSELPLPFGIVKGDFDCDNNCLTDLKNSPVSVFGEFDCGNNWLTSLRGCPEYIQKKFGLDENPDIKLDGNFPKEIGSINIDVDIINDMKLDDYPPCIITTRGTFANFQNNLDIICNTVYDNKEKFVPLVGNRILFHQQVMRLYPSLIPFYETIKPPSTKTII